MDPASFLKNNFHNSTVIIAEYIWIDANYCVRSKSRTLPRIDGKICDHCDQIPIWNYDGSSTGQSKTAHSDIILKPVYFVFDPFRGYPNILVLCETYNSDGNPLETNKRSWAEQIFENSVNIDDPWFGMEQEFFFMTPQNRPIGFPLEGQAESQGKYYCGVGAKHIYGREIMDEFYNNCIYASIKISGINAEVANSQWEFQIGPCSGLEVGDHLWIARYILQRVAEKYGVDINYHPKPLGKNWNGSGLHTNYSTVDMRCDNGLTDIKVAIKKLEVNHMTHMSFYGTDNELRMTGECETAEYHKFTWANRNRGTSIRIPSQVVDDGKGYLEDRRPASNADPYTVAGLIYQTTRLDEIDD